MTEIMHYRYRYPLKLFFRIQSKHGPEPAEYVCRFDGKIFTSITARRHVISAHPGRLEDMVSAGIVRKKFAKKEEVVRSRNGMRNLMIHRDVILKQIGREDLLEETA